MPNRITKHLIFTGLSLLLTLGASAQPKDNSPFSQFGIGDFFESSLPSSHGMGGLTAAYHDFFEGNLDNPASLGYMQYTSLQVSAFIKHSAYTRIDTKQGIWNGNVDQLSLNIPLINPLNEALERRESAFNWTTSFSLRPYSQVGYHIQIADEIDSTGLGVVTRDFKGSGGLYQVNWANGWKYKNLAAGLTLTYLSGDQTYNEEILFPDLESSYGDLFRTDITYKAFQYRLGLQYEHPLDLQKARAKNESPTKFLSAGFYYTGQSDFKTKSNVLKLAYNAVLNDLDTVQNVKATPGTGTFPSTYAFGMMYRQAGKFRVGFDYQASNWSVYRNEIRPDTLKNASRFAVGAAWIPDAESLLSYFKRVEYRIGFYTKSDPRVIEGSQVKEYAVTVGLNLPLILQRNIAWVLFSLDAGHRSGGDRLTDNFVRAKLGFVLNDNSWFIRSKYH